MQRDGKEIVLKPKQLVLATGMSAKANMPKFEGMEIFKGDQHHSSQHPGPDKYKDKKAVIIGSNNSAHDICVALMGHCARQQNADFMDITAISARCGRTGQDARDAELAGIFNRPAQPIRKKMLQCHNGGAAVEMSPIYAQFFSRGLKKFRRLTSP